jgi:lipopolysaccharide/colanic/teichoic acid biosynthesis glycosyltransferase
MDAWAPSEHWRSPAHRLAKRSLDVVVAAVALTILLPAFALIALLVRVSSPGPIILRQLRIGQGGRPFAMLKFRTMFDGSDPAIHQEYYRRLVGGRASSVDGTFKMVEDPRITPAGRILRRLSLDELPQLLNVLKGDMSLVGPRPPLPYEVELYDERARLRLSVPPGASGLWQVSGRNRLNFEQMIDLDLAYIDQWSLWLDVWILLRTPLAVLSGGDTA